MPRSTLARELSQAEEQIAKDPDRIAHQRAVVSHIEEGGLDSAIARAILEQLETLQRMHIADRDRLLAEAALDNKLPNSDRTRTRSGTDQRLDYEKGRAAGRGSNGANSKNDPD
jgi:hypothetical protein